MSVQTPYVPEIKDCDGVSHIYNFGFRTTKPDYVKAGLQDPATGAIAAGVYGVDYTVSLGAPLPAAGSITWATGGDVAGKKLVIWRQSSPIEQLSNFDPAKAFASGGPEAAFDLLTLMMQEQAARIDRTYRIPDGDALATTPAGPDVVARANRLAGWNAAGNLVPVAGTGGALVSAAMGDVVAAATLAAARAKMGAMTVYDVTDYGAAADDTTDLGAAITAAIAAAPDGAIIFIPPADGIYALKTQVTIDKAVHIFGGGANAGANVRLVGAITGFSIDMTEGVSVSGFRYYGDRTTNQIGFAITGWEGVIRDMQIDLMDTAIDVSNGNHFRLDALRMRNHKTRVIHLRGTTVGTIIDNCTYGTDTGTYAEPTTAGIHVQAEGIVVSNCDFIWSGIGLLIECPSTRDIHWCLFQNSFFDTCGQSGIVIRNDQAARKIYGLFFNHVWSATASGTGAGVGKGLILLGTGSGDIDGLHFTNCMFHNNQREAAYIDYANAKNIEFDGCVFAGNSAIGAGTANNVFINIGGPASFTNCKFKCSMTWATSPYTHLFVNTRANNTFIDGCEFDANVTNSIFVDASSGTVSFGRNKGLVTENRGTGTINNGSTSATVNHGLSVTPTAADIWVSFTENPSTDPGNIWISGISATQFTVNCRTNPGASNLDFSWGARVISQ